MRLAGVRTAGLVTAACIAELAVTPVYANRNLTLLAILRTPRGQGIPAPAPSPPSQIVVAQNRVFCQQSVRMTPEGRTEETGRFPSTHWSEVKAAAKPDVEQGREALGRLLERYRPALVAYAIKKFGANQDQARDLFQGFVLESVLKRGLIEQARAIKGHQFRSYLLQAWHTFIQEQHRRQSCGKRRPPGGLEPLSDPTNEQPGLTPEPAPEVFDVEWVREVIAEAVRLMRVECEGNGRADVWGVFEARVHRPILADADPLPYDQLVGRFGLESPIRARNLLVTGKRMFARCLRGVVAEYAHGEAAVETELRELQIILERAG